MMDAFLPSAGRAFWLLFRLRVRRMFNMSGMLFRRRAKGGKSRPATAGKGGVRVLVTLMMAGFMTAAFVNMSSMTILNLNCHLGAGSYCDAQITAHLHEAAAAVAASAFSPALAQGIALELAALVLVAIILPLGSKELANPDWDLEWLITLPMQRNTLLWARIAERAIANPTGWLTLWPLCLMIAWHSGFRWTAPLLATAVALLLLVIAAALRTVVDTGLRLRLAPSQLRNLQAVASVASLPLMYFVMSLSMPTAALTMGWAARAPAWLLWTPAGLVVQALNTRNAVHAAIAAALLIAQAILTGWACMVVLRALLANGVVATGSRETGRKAATPAAAATAISAAPSRTVIGTPLQRRELRLLSRDRGFLVQSLLLPVIIIGSQLIFNGKIENTAELGANPSVLAAMAFGIGGYVLMLSAFQTLNREGQALWMLYTFPRSIESVLKEKAQLWTALATFYPLVIFSVGIACGAKPDVQFFSLMILALAGIPIFSMIAVSLGVWGCDPLAEEASQRVRPTFVYTYFVLCSFYTIALYTSEWHLKLAVIVLMAALALALWQKARDALPYMLDTTATPPPRVSAADGIMAALLFFTIQIIALLFLSGRSQPTIGHLTFAFAIAGGVTYALARLIYWRSRTAGVPRLLPASYGAAAGWSLAMAAIAIGFAAAYLAVLRHLGVSVPALNGSIRWILPLAVLAAPLFEEFIFRGLIFGGLRRSMPAGAAMFASAAIFAVVHPPLSMLPVFIVGLCTAVAYERSKSLLAPMLTHALYNAAMIALQM